MKTFLLKHIWFSNQKSNNYFYLKYISLSSFRISSVRFTKNAETFLRVKIGFTQNLRLTF